LSFVRFSETSCLEEEASINWNDETAEDANNVGPKLNDSEFAGDLTAVVREWITDVIISNQAID